MLTKQGLLSFISSIYDPFGMISLLILEPKLIIQTWGRNLALDKQLPDDIKQR